MMRTTFEEVSITASKAGRCSGCGKRRQRQRRFFQTLNPWNRLTDGTPKSRGDIYKELVVEASKWRKEPIACCPGAAAGGGDGD